MSNICENCTYFQRYPHWSKEKSCIKAVYNHGSEGYGPFFVRATCIHDERFEMPSSQYVPIGESVIKNYEIKIDELEKIGDQLKKENKILIERITKI